MQVERFDAQDERAVVTALVVSDGVLARIAPKFDPQLLPSPWSRAVARWCVKYHEDHGEAPKKRIRELFSAWARKQHNESTVALVEEFLFSLSDDYEGLAHETNDQFILDLASKLFNRQKARNLYEAIGGAIEEDDPDEVLALTREYDRVELASIDHVDLFNDEEAVRAAFTQSKEALIEYPGAAGKFLSSALCREQLTAFLAPEKRGKSTMLRDLAFNAALQRRRVAYFDAGDNSQAQLVQYFGARAARSPVFRPENDVYKYPISLTLDKDYQPCVKHEERECRESLSPGRAVKAFQKIVADKIKSNDSYLRISCHPTKTLEASAVATKVMSWARAGWVADAVVIDYADILALPSHFRSDVRGGTEETWAVLRQLSLAMHCLVLTATQADAASYGVKTMGMGNFSEDKRKNAHATAIVAINQSPQELEQGVTRLTYVVNRFAPNDGRKVYLAGCKEIENPCVRSL